MFHPDHDLVEQQSQEIQKEALEISLECASQPHPPDCVALQLQEIFGLSHPCGLCFADHSMCLLTSCLAPCATELESEGCACCLEDEGCGDALKTCTGLSPGVDLCQ